MILILMITLSSCTGVQQNPDFDKNVEIFMNARCTFILYEANPHVMFSSNGQKHDRQ